MISLGSHSKQIKINIDSDRSQRNLQNYISNRLSCITEIFSLRLLKFLGNRFRHRLGT
jgi:hypothetical protein